MMYKDFGAVYLQHKWTYFSILCSWSWEEFLPHAQRSHAYPICGNITSNCKDMLFSAFRLVYYIQSVMSIRAGHLGQGHMQSQNSTCCCQSSSDMKQELCRWFRFRFISVSNTGPYLLQVNLICCVNWDTNITNVIANYLPLCCFK